MVKKFYGNYRGEVMSDADEHGRVRIFVRGVYPDNMRSKIDELPLAEPAMPLTNGGCRLRTENRNLEAADKIPETEELPIGPDVDLSSVSTDLAIEAFDPQTDKMKELVEKTNKDSEFTQEAYKVAIQQLIQAQKKNLSAISTFSQNMLDKLKAGMILSTGETGVELTLEQQKEQIEQRIEIYEEKLRNYPPEETENIAATEKAIADLKSELEDLGKQIAEQEDEEDGEVDQDLSFGGLFQNPTGHSVGAIKGQFVWIFFEGGNQNFPIYFASCPAGEAWGSNSPGLIISNTKGIKNTIDETLFIGVDKKRYEALQELTNTISPEVLATFTIENKNNFSELKSQTFKDFILENIEKSDENTATVNQSTKPELLRAIDTSIKTQLTQGVNLLYDTFNLSETTTHGMFNFQSQQQFLSAFKFLMMASMFIPNITQPLLLMIKPFLEQITGTSIKITYDADGKPTYHVVIGGNVRVIMNGNLDLLQNGSTNEVRTGAKTEISNTNIIVPHPVSLIDLISIGVVAVPIPPTPQTIGDTTEGDGTSGIIPINDTPEYSETEISNAVFQEQNGWKLTGITNTEIGVFYGTCKDDRQPQSSKLYFNGKKIYEGGEETITRGVVHNDAVYFAGENGHLLIFKNGQVFHGRELRFAISVGLIGGIPYVFDNDDNRIRVYNCLTGQPAPFSIPGIGVVCASAEYNGMVVCAANEYNSDECGFSFSNGMVITAREPMCVIVYKGRLIGSTENKVVEINPSSESYSVLATLDCDKITDMSIYGGFLYITGDRSKQVLYKTDGSVFTKLVQFAGGNTMGGSLFCSRYDKGYYGRSANGNTAIVYKIT